MHMRSGIAPIIEITETECYIVVVIPVTKEGQIKLAS